MRPGDVVVGFGAKEVTEFQSLIDAVADTMPGERVGIVVLRAELRVDLLVEIGRSGLHRP
jgi:serine protease Do